MPTRSSPHRHRSLLADVQQRFVIWIFPRIPKRVTSLQLTAIGVLGAAGASVGLIGCNWSLMCLPVVALGVGMNWFGDLLDGELIRLRGEEPTRLGFFIDHTSDLFSLVMLIVAFGLSPFLSLIAALAILLCFLLFSAYTYIRAAARHVRQMSYLGVGAMEFRILMIAWAFVAAVAGVREPLLKGLSKLDTVVLILVAFAIVGLAVKAVIDARHVAAEENAGFLKQEGHPSEAAADHVPAE